MISYLTTGLAISIIFWGFVAIRRNKIDPSYFISIFLTTILWPFWFFVMTWHATTYCIEILDTLEERDRKKREENEKIS